MNQPYATLTLASALREMFGVQLYKNNARVLLYAYFEYPELDWLQHSRSVRGVKNIYKYMNVYECIGIHILMRWKITLFSKFQP